MDARALALAAVAFTIVNAHVSTNILRIQLWDEEGLTREYITTEPPRHRSKVDLATLDAAMMRDEYEHGTRLARHKVRHKRRRPRQSDDLPWRFHSGASRNVAVFDEDMPWEEIEGRLGASVSDSDSSVREVAPPMTLRQDDEEEEVKKQLPVVPKCCASGQNLTVTYEDGKVKSVCTRSTLTFQPIFHKANETHIFSYDSNVFETIVGNPCPYEKYKLEPDIVSEDEFYLLFNGSLFAPFKHPHLLGVKDYCMETFWNESIPAGVTLPLVCFQSPLQETKSSMTLIAYATGLMISVPFLLATAVVYLCITELRDTHGKALACHSIFLAVAFICLAATQLAGHAFPAAVCTTMAYLIQFSFVSCFFWLNVMCFDTYLNVRRYIDRSVTVRSMRRRFAWYCAYAIVLPVVLLIVTIVMDLSPAVPSTYLKPNFGVKGCWFKTDQAALPYFYGPVAIILVSNLIIFFMTARAFAAHDKLLDISPLEIQHSNSTLREDLVQLENVLGTPVPERSSQRDSNNRLTFGGARISSGGYDKLKVSPLYLNRSGYSATEGLVQLENVPETPAERPTTLPLSSNISARFKKYKKVFRTCCLLSVIMGISWVLEVVSWAAGADAEAVSVWSVFDLINALQGVLIFAIYVMQQPVRSYVKISRLCKDCRRKGSSEVSVVSYTNTLDSGRGRRAYV
ncbi:G-protein coupled receptor Mth2-like [Aricia agestis]|uniref:G-protein coupled receptor Mth2-like n=1 Tax=Aricia agestis TaxID=91739 RepID=UPI001C20830F|nr:G-protein coupled receptor Mth2-like [Aricia agestis]